MSKRSYKKYTDILSELKALIKRSREDGETVLPVERKLAVMLETSRMTLRKAMDEARELGLLTRDANKTIIINALPSRPRVAFLANGHHSAFILPALERLWLNLKPCLMELDMESQLILSDRNQTTSDVIATIAAADVILVASFSVSDPDVMFRELLAMQQHKLVIGVLENFAPIFNNTITLDNYAAGTVAAHALLNAGCRNMLCFYYDRLYQDISFLKRAQGFVETVGQAGLCATSHWLKTSIADYPEYARNFINSKAKEGVDGFFIMSDEGIDTISADLFSGGLVPEHISIVSLNGSGSALRHDPPISCVSHATNGVIRAIADTICRPTDSSVKIRIKPRLYLNNGLKPIPTEGIVT